MRHGWAPWIVLVATACSDPAAHEPPGGVPCQVDADCTGAHAVCDDRMTSPVCACAAGYTASGAACAWSGVIKDPGFEGSTADISAAWTIDGPAVIDGSIHEP